MAGDEDKKAMLLWLSLLDAKALRKIYGYDDPDNEASKRRLMQVWKEHKERNRLLQQDAEAHAAKTASLKKHQSQVFIREVKNSNTLYAEMLMKTGADVNSQDKYGMTALHYAAATGFRPCVRMLVNSGLCNYLLKDNKGRLASELAYEWGKDYAVGLLLQKKEVRQAYEESQSSPVDTPDGDAP